MKIVDPNKEELINSNVKLFTQNLDKIVSNTNNVTIRIPLVPNYTYTDENINKIIDVLKNRNIKKVELFGIHRLGENKYKLLGLKMPKFRLIKDEEIIGIRNQIANYSKEVNIIKI